VAELADAADLKSAGAILVGSSPSPGTTRPEYVQTQHIDLFTTTTAPDNRPAVSHKRFRLFYRLYLLHLKVQRYNYTTVI
jgi:hypothetical protein